MADLNRSAKMRRIFKVVVGVALAYVSLWAIMWFAAPYAIRRQLMREAKESWSAARISAERSAQRRAKECPDDLPPEIAKWLAESGAFSSGPSVDVRLISCPVPFFARAECGRYIGGLNGYGSYDDYVVVFWAAFRIHSHRTWVS